MTPEELVTIRARCETEQLVFPEGIPAETITAIQYAFADRHVLLAEIERREASGLVRLSEEILQGIRQQERDEEWARIRTAVEDVPVYYPPLYEGGVVFIRSVFAAIDARDEEIIPDDIRTAALKPRVREDMDDPFVPEHEHQWERGKHMAEAFGIDGRRLACAICGTVKTQDIVPVGEGKTIMRSRE